MTETLRPAALDALCACIKEATQSKTPLMPEGNGTMRAFGRPVTNHTRLSLGAFEGITLYEPEELVLSAGAATPLADINAILADHHQELAFEPADMGPLYGRAPGGATIGGVLACNLSGPRRVKAGAARDHFLGLEAVSGRGEVFRSGGRVVKNVTGYDVGKLIAGSFGTLAALTKVTLKVLPAAPEQTTLLLKAPTAGDGVSLLSRALASPYDVSGAAFAPAACSLLPEHTADVAALRLEGHGASLQRRLEALTAHLNAGGDRLDDRQSRAFWGNLRDLTPFVRHGDLALWRIACPPSEGARFAALAETIEGSLYIMDWGGGLVWLGTPDNGYGFADPIRALVAETGGHAALWRASPETCAEMDILQPPDAALLPLVQRLKEAFDPAGILNPNRLYRYM